MEGLPPLQISPRDSSGQPDVVAAVEGQPAPHTCGVGRAGLFVDKGKPIVGDGQEAPDGIGELRHSAASAQRRQHLPPKHLDERLLVAVDVVDVDLVEAHGDVLLEPGGARRPRAGSRCRAARR